VIVDGDILGKPADEDDARGMLQRLAGRRHEVTTAQESARPRAGTRGHHHGLLPPAATGGGRRLRRLR
jgi:predicted house-cleaning NTP pyrophosphatase (Maf/HAM1 superfamily)